MKSRRRSLLVLIALCLPFLTLSLLKEGLLEAEQSAATAAGDRYYVDASRDEGLVAYWRFDETAGSGTSDVSKTGAHGTLSGNAAFVDNLPGPITFPNQRALSLDGNSDYVDTKDFDLTDNFTISLWMYPQSSADQNMIGKHDGSGNNLLLFGMYRESYHVRIRGEWFDSTDPVSPGWHHMAVTGEKIGANSTRIRLYRNGVEKQVETLDAVVGDLSPGLAWTIGQDWDGVSRSDYYNGLLDDIRIYNRTLSADEISQLGSFGNDIDGGSWEDAYTTLERALGMAVNGDEIWVAAGVYTPTRLAITDPLEPRSATFRLGTGVAHYGGFAGTETSLSQRQPGSHVTVLSGDLDGNDVTNAQGVVVDTADIVGDNAFHVVSSLSVGEGITTLDGFTITAGKANYDGGGVFSNGWGGGIYHAEGSPLLNNLILQGNDADLGGGMYAISGQPVLSQIHFEANTAKSGGGMYNNQADPQLSDVNFQSNRATDYGGGMYNTQADAVLDRATFNDNYAGVSGGGIYNLNSQGIYRKVSLSENEAHVGGAGAVFNNGSNIQFIASTVLTNTAGSGGGGMVNYMSDPLILSSVFSGNDAYTGGGISNSGSMPVIQWTTFSGNSAVTHGAGIFSGNGSAPTLSRVTLSGNTAGVNGGGIYNLNGEISIYNAFFDRNSAGISGGGSYFQLSTPKLGNVVFVANSSNGEGGGFVAIDSQLQVSNVTVAYNRADTIGGGVYVSTPFDGSLLANSILWGNQADVDGLEIFINSGFAITETHNLISGTAGVSPTSPFLIDPDPGPDQDWGTADDNLGDLRLEKDSQATDAGSNDFILEDAPDLDDDGNLIEPLPFDLGDHPRVYNSTVDIGAYEWKPFFVYAPFIKK